MKIYLAGGISGNLSSRWKKIINGGGKMKIYLAGEHPTKNGRLAMTGGGQHYILESFFYARNNQWIESLIPRLDDFILDSGGFTAMQGNAGTMDWDKFIEEYADFILRNKITKFFELDIDSVVGLKETERLRGKLERITGMQSIPVWHKSRGLDYYKGMVKDYPYVSIGGIVSREIPRSVYERGFPYFIEQAHENGAKIHALGYTNIAGLHKYHFDSVDSTAWLYGNRGGYLYVFNEIKGIIEQVDKPNGTRLKSTEAALHNYKEWQKFQQYAINNL